MSADIVSCDKLKGQCWKHCSSQSECIEIVYSILFMSVDLSWGMDLKRFMSASVNGNRKLHHGEVTFVSFFMKMVAGLGDIT